MKISVTPYFSYCHYLPIVQPIPGSLPGLQCVCVRVCVRVCVCVLQIYLPCYATFPAIPYTSQYIQRKSR